jgi:molybdate transport system regulatory protein
MPKHVEKLFKSKHHLKVNGSLWLECNDKKYFGPGPMELLERIEKTGSINKAAKQMGMSYKKSWEIINRLNKYSITPLVETQAGGKKGGGSFVSTDAKLLIAGYQELRKQFQEFLDKQTSIL